MSFRQVLSTMLTLALLGLVAACGSQAGPAADQVEAALSEDTTTKASVAKETAPAAAEPQDASLTTETAAAKPTADKVALVKTGYKVGDRIPEFYVRPLDASKITSQQMLDGGRPVFLYFFETW